MTASQPDRRRRLGNARTARYRARLRAGRTVVRVPIDNEVIGLLLDLGWLQMSVSEDREEIALAIFRMLKDAAKSA